MMYVNGRAVTPACFIKENHNYSTEEQIVGTWFGKPLYEKTLELNFTISEWNSTNRYFVKDISAMLPNADVVIFKGGYFSTAVTGYALNPMYNSSELKYCAAINVYRDSVRLYLGGDRSNTNYANYTYYVIVHYTKTTDIGGGN